ncbi:MAG: alpha/beta hydrolase [Promethearchaeota archaeon]
MTILDKTKMRKDVMKICSKGSRLQAKGAADFIRLEENKDFDLMRYMAKIAEGNKEFFIRFPKKDDSVKDLYDLLSYEEQVSLAKLFRHSVEYAADAELNTYPISDYVKIELVDLDGVPAEWQIVPGAIEDKVLLYFHGGGQVIGSPKYLRLLTVELAKLSKMKVLSVDYRLAPEHPFPAGLEDSITAYKWLLNNGYDAKNIIFGGDSSGGNRVLSALLKIRDESIELPRGAFALSPAIDYSDESETVYKNAETDPILADVGVFWWDPAYVRDEDPYNPYISPIHADLKGLPSILLQVSTCEMLYDHSTRFYERAKAAGVDITLQEWDDMMHVWQSFGIYRLPESQEAIDKIIEFINNLLGSKKLETISSTT